MPVTRMTWHDVGPPQVVEGKPFMDDTVIKHLGERIKGMTDRKTGMWRDGWSWHPEKLLDYFFSIDFSELHCLFYCFNRWQWSSRLICTWCCRNLVWNTWTYHIIYIEILYYLSLYLLKLPYLYQCDELTLFNFKSIWNSNTSNMRFYICGPCNKKLFVCCMLSLVKIFLIPLLPTKVLNCILTC